MEPNKKLIITLIQQDLEHNQLTKGLEMVGLNTSVHGLEIIELVIVLFGIHPDKVADQWAEAYLSYLEKSKYYPITDRGEELIPLAEECYLHLIELTPERT